MKNFLKFISCLFFLYLFLPNALADTPKKEALFYKKLDSKTVQCHLCPRFCVISDGKRGYCRIRENNGGILYTLSFAKPVSLNALDPIEKKPLFHFLPGTKTFSLSTAGCNLNCKFCQNWEISQKAPEEVEFVYLEPQELIDKVKASGLNIIAYTYTEPTIFYEYMLETAKLAKAGGIRNVMHSNGFINPEPLQQLAQYLDAANIDLKGFSDDYYVKMCAGTLAPVLASLKILKQEGVHLEITNLVLPSYNDDADSTKKMCLWIKENLGADTPLHFSRFWPMYKLAQLNPTPIETLQRLRQAALGCGLKYVYIGNIGTNPAENTYCPKCGKIVIGRRGYFIVENNIIDGKCKFCAERISGVWN
ncbi:MAG: AmmeMemoRadiSam system radical SAM enzyme [Candidatus Omnitrophota bacterium]